MYYAIENINNKYVVKKVINGTLIIPVSPIFRKLESAQNFADDKGYTIEKVGDLYEII